MQKKSKIGTDRTAERRHRKKMGRVRDSILRVYKNFHRSYRL